MRAGPATSKRRRAGVVSQLVRLWWGLALVLTVALTDLPRSWASTGLAISAVETELAFLPGGEVRVLERYRVLAPPEGWQGRFDRVIEPRLALSDGSTVRRTIEPRRAQLGDVSLPLALETDSRRTWLSAVLTRPIAGGAATILLDYSMTSALLARSSVALFTHDAVPHGHSGSGKQAWLRLPDPGSAPPAEVRLWVTFGGERRQVNPVLSRIDGRLEVRPPEPLRPGEGLLVSVSYPTAVLSEVHAAAASAGGARAPLVAAYWIALALALLLVGLALLAGLLVARGRRAASLDSFDGDGLFRPPYGLGPAAVRFIRDGTCDDVALAATVTALAQKGYLTIEEIGGGQFMLQRTWREGDLGLTLTERAVAAAFYDLRPARFFLTPGHQREIQLGRQGLRRTVTDEIRRGTARAAGQMLRAQAVLVGVLVAVFGLWQAGAAGIVLALIAGSGVYLATAHLSWVSGRYSASRQQDRSHQLRYLGYGLGAAAVLLGFAAGGVRLGLAVLLLGLVQLGAARVQLAQRGFGGLVRQRVRQLEDVLAGQIVRGGLVPERSRPSFESALAHAIALDCESAWARLFEPSGRRRGEVQQWRPRWFGTEHALSRPTEIATFMCGALIEALRQAEQPGQRQGSARAQLEDA